MPISLKELRRQGKERVDKIAARNTTPVNNTGEVTSSAQVTKPTTPAVQQNKPVPQENIAPFDPNMFNVWSRSSNYDFGYVEPPEEIRNNMLRTSRSKFNVLPHNYSKLTDNINNYKDTQDPNLLKEASLNLEKLKENLNNDFGFKIKNTSQFKSLEKDLLDKEQELNNLLIDNATQTLGVDSKDLLNKANQLSKGVLDKTSTLTLHKDLINLGMYMSNKGKPGSSYYNDDIYAEAVSRGVDNQLRVRETYRAAKTGVGVLQKGYNEELQAKIGVLKELEKEIAKFPKEFKTQDEVDLANNIQDKYKKTYDEIKDLEKTAKSTANKILTSLPEWKEQYENDVKNSSGDLTFGEKSLKTFKNIAKAALTDKSLWLAEKAGLIPKSYAAMESEIARSDNWMIDTDEKGNPVYSNTMTYKDSEGNRRFNARGIFEVGSGIAGDMVFTIAVTKGLAGGISKIAKYAALDARLAGSKKTIDALNSLTPEYLMSNAATSRALTFPSVYLTTYPKTYFANLNNYKDLDKASAAAHTQTIIESLTESIIPDVQFFNKSRKAGQMLTRGELKEGLTNIVKGSKDFSVSKFRGKLGKVSKLALTNFIQEGVIEEQAAYVANELLDPYYKSLNPEMKNEEDFIDSLWDSSLGMLVSSIGGIPSNIKQINAQSRINFKDPSTLIELQWQIGSMPESMKKDIALTEGLDAEQKVKAFKIVDAYAKQYKDSFDTFTQPSKQDLGKDINKVYTHFGLNLLKQHKAIELFEKMQEQAKQDATSLYKEDEILAESIDITEAQKELDTFTTKINELEQEEREYKDLTTDEKQDHWFGLYKESFKKETDIAKSAVRIAKHIKDIKENKDNLAPEVYFKYKNAIREIVPILQAKAKEFFKEIDEISDKLPTGAIASLGRTVEIAAQLLPQEGRQEAIVKSLSKLNDLYEAAAKREGNKTQEEVAEEVINPPEATEITPQEEEKPKEEIGETLTEEEFEQQAKASREEAERVRLEKKAVYDKFYEEGNIEELHKQMMLEPEAQENPELAQEVIDHEGLPLDKMNDLGPMFLYAKIRSNALKNVEKEKAKAEETSEAKNIVDESIPEVELDEVEISNSFKPDAELGFTTSGEYNTSDKDISTPTEKRIMNFLTSVINALITDPARAIKNAYIASNTQLFNELVGEEGINSFADKVLEYKLLPEEERADKEAELQDILKNLLPEDSIKWYLSDRFKGKTKEDVIETLTRGITFVVADKDNNPIYSNKEGTAVSSAKTYPVYRRLPIVRLDKSTGKYSMSVTARNTDTPAGQGMLKNIYDLQERAANKESFKAETNIEFISDGFSKVTDNQKQLFEGNLNDASIKQRKVMVDVNGTSVVLMTSRLSKEDIELIQSLIFDYKELYKSYMSPMEMASYLNKITYLRNGNIYIRAEGEELNIYSSTGDPVTRELLGKYLEGRNYNLLLPAINDEFSKISIENNRIVFTPYINYGEYLKEHLYHHHVINQGNRKIYYSFKNTEFKEKESDKANVAEGLKRARRGRDSSETRPLFSSREQRDKSPLEERILALTWYRDNFDSSPIKLEYSTASHPEAFAQFLKDTITLYEGSESTDIYHEAWHNFSQNYLTKAEKQELYYAAAEALGIKEDVLASNYLRYEEELADAFKKFMMDSSKIQIGDKTIQVAKPKKQYKGLIGLFKRIKDFFASIVKKDDLITSYFKEASKVKGHKKFNTKNAIFTDSLNTPKTFLDKDGNEVTLEKRTVKEILSNLDYMFAKEFETQYPGTPFSTLSLQSTNLRNQILNDVYDEIYNQIADLEESSQEPMLKDIYAMILDNFNTFIKEHVASNNIFTQSFTINLEETSSVNEESKLEISESYEKKGSLELAEKTILNLIKLIPLVDKKGDLILSPITNLPTLGNFNDNWTILQKNLTGLSYDKMLSKIEELTVKYPQFTYLLKNLPREFSADKISSLIFRNQFHKTFSMPFVDIYNGVMRDDATFSYSFLQAGTSSVSKIKTAWQIKSIEEDLYREENDGLNKLNIDSLLQQFPNVPNTFETGMSFLHALGIQFNDTVKIKKLLGNITMNADYRDAIERIHAKLISLKKTSPLLANPVESIMREHIEVIKGNKVKVKGENKSIEYLASLEVDTNEEVASDMIIAANGTTVWKYVQNNYITKFINDFANKTTEEIFELYPNLDPSKTPSVVQSLWFNQMFVKNKENKYEKTNQNLEYIKVGGLNSQLIEKGDSTVDLTMDDKFIYDFLSFIKNGTEEMIRFGDKATTGATKLVSRISDIKPGEIDKMVSVIVQQIIGEVVEVKHLKDLYQEFKDGKIPFMHKYNKKNLDKLVVFRWLGDELEKELFETEFSDNKGFLYLDNRTEGPQKDLYNKLRFKINEHIEKKGAEIQGMVDRLVSNVEGFSTSDLLQDANADIRTVSQWYFASSYATRLETFNILFGSLRNFKDGTAVFKRMSMYSATGDFSAPDNTTLSVLNSSEKLRRSIEEFYTNKKRDWSDKFTSVHFKEEPIKSPTAKDSYFESIKQYIPEEDHDDLKAILAQYAKGEYADASGAVTLDFYKFLSYSIGTWDAPQQEAYDKQVEFVKAKKQFEDNLIEATELERIKTEANQSVGKLISILNPKKWQYAGSIHSQDSIAAKMDVRAFEKFSIHPLLPSMVDGTKMENVAMAMYTNGVDMYNFDSGSKLAWDKASYDFNTVSKATEGAILSPTVLSLNSFKEQLPIANKFKDEGIFSSQMRKLLSLGLYEEGRPVGNAAARHSYNKYKKSIQDYTDILKKEIDSRIGTTQDLVDFIKEEFDKREIPDYVQDFLNVVDGKLQYPLDQSLHIFYTQNIISSIVNNRLVRQKLPGGQFIQVPNYGYSNPSENDLTEYGRDGLNFYHIDPKTGEVMPMEIKISFGNKWKPLLRLPHKDGNIIGTLERLNESLADKDFVKEHGKSFTLVGCRIPVQGLNTIETMVVKQFLPPVSGQIIIVPAEITKKTGSDFDIDKMNIYEPQLDRDGTLIGTMDNHTAAYDEIADKISVLKNSIEGINGFINDIYNSLSPDQLERLEEVKEMKKELHDLKNNLNSSEEEEEFTLENLVASTQEGYVAEDFEKRNKRINDIKSRLNSEKDIMEALEAIREETREAKQLSRNIKSLRNDMKTIKNSIVNDMITSISELLLNRDNYVSLITPNETPVLNDIYDHNKIGSDTFNITDVLYPQTSLSAFDKYTVAKSSLGIDAKMNTFYALAMEAGLRLTEASPSIFGEETSLSSKFTHPSKVKYDTNNAPVDISKFIAEFISGHVDIANDARIAEIRADRNLTPIYLYGVMRRIHPNDMVDFLTNPKLQTLIKKLKNSDSITMRHLYNLKFGKQEASKKLNKDAIKKVFLLELLKDNPAPGVIARSQGSTDLEKTAENIINSESASQDLKYFAEFVIMQRDSGFLKDLDTSLSHDTSNYKSFIEYQYPDYIFTEVIKRNFFHIDSILKMRNESSISPLRVSNYVFDKFSKHYDIIANQAFVAKALDLYTKSFGVPIDKFARDFTNDFLTFLLQNLVENKGVNLYQEFIVEKRLLDRTNPNNIEKQINALIKELGPKANYITDNEFYKAFYFEKSTDPKEKMIFPRLKNPSLDNHSKEIVNEELMKLLNPSFAGVDNDKIRNTFKLLTNVAFLHNGTNQPLGSMISVLPTETYTALFNSMLKDDAITEGINVGSSYLWRNFVTLFKQRRSRYFSSSSGKKAETYDKYNYFIPKANVVQENNVSLQEDMTEGQTDNIYDKLGDKTESGNVQINPVYQKAGVTYAKSIGGIFSMRLNHTDKHFGNPYGNDPSTVKKDNLIKTNSTQESVEKYIDWVLNSDDARANWIREQLQSGILKNRPIVYYKELGEPSHATALDYLINKYEWPGQDLPWEENKVKDISEPISKEKFEVDTLIQIAEVKAINEYLSKNKIEFYDFPKDLTQDQLDEEYQKGSNSEYIKVIKTAQELRSLPKNTDELLYDENGETDVNRIETSATDAALYLQNSDGSYAIDTGSFQDLLKSYIEGEIDEELMDSAKEILKKYGLDKMILDYNPAQLQLFESETDVRFTKDFNEFYLSELEKSPNITEEQALEVFKNCHKK